MRLTCLIGVALVICLGASAQTNSYTATPIITNIQDPFLVNPWGLSGPVNPNLIQNQWWAADNATGFGTLYAINKPGRPVPMVITIPAGIGSGKGSPTGTAFNATVGPGPGSNNFTFATLDGTISNWNGGQKPPPGGSGCSECHVTTATVMVNHSSTGASYFGLTFAPNSNTQPATYYATNFNGGVEAYDATTFLPVTLSGTFMDPRIPASYKPYGIKVIGSKIWVTFFNGTSRGFVDAFDTNGRLKVRLATGSFSGPWGIAQAPANFGAFSNRLLVGNTASGRIGAYSPTTGAFQGFLQDSTGNTIVIPGLWGIAFGNGNKQSGPVTTLYYVAGGNQYLTGVFGAITAN